jgi:antitoxin (DNA-binding transcriptional repressor) of toxin-antitoxin stability system
MRTATVLDLQNNFAMLEAWILNGEEVCIEKRGQPFAVIKAMEKDPESPIVNPDFEARRRAIWGDRVFSEEEVKAMREYEHEHEKW